MKSDDEVRKRQNAHLHTNYPDLSGPFASVPPTDGLKMASSGKLLYEDATVGMRVSIKGKHGTVR